jgi:hypothetical protein
MLPLYVADFLHLVKNVRSRLMKYVTAIRWKDKAITFNSGNIDRLLHLGPVLADKSSTGKMRDSYPLALFRFEYAIELI